MVQLQELLTPREKTVKSFYFGESSSSDGASCGFSVSLFLPVSLAEQGRKTGGRCCQPARALGQKRKITLQATPAKEFIPVPHPGGGLGRERRKWDPLGFISGHGAWRGLVRGWIFPNGGKNAGFARFRPFPPLSDLSWALLPPRVVAPTGPRSRFAPTVPPLKKNIKSSKNQDLSPSNCLQAGKESREGEAAALSGEKTSGDASGEREQQEKRDTRGDSAGSGAGAPGQQDLPLSSSQSALRVLP